jgi:predicted RNA-binding Zn-ribbon protein involved in translation (DUF1610 family)
MRGRRPRYAVACPCGWDGTRSGGNNHACPVCGQYTVKRRTALGSSTASGDAK